jgi:pentatricopeptide repeat protein
MYCRCGSLEEAYELFFRLETRDVITYSTLVGALVDQDRLHPHPHPHPHQACLELVWEMLGNGLRPNRYVYLCAIKACARAEDASRGRYVNGAVFEDGWDRDVFIRSYLVGLYATCGALEDARAIFDMLPVRDVVLWGSMMEEYVKQGQHLGALELYERMQRSDVEPNKVVFLSLLKACGGGGGGHSSREQGKCIHGQIVRNEWERDVMIGSSLVDMYAKCGHLAEARNVFARLPEKTAVTWASMITGHVEHGSAAAAIELFDEMMKERVKPDGVVFLGLLKACGDVGDAARCRRVHASIVGAEFEGDRDVNDALVDAYAKCGSRDEAMALFRKEHGQIVGDGLESDVVIGSALMDMCAKQASVDEARNVGIAHEDSASYGALISGYVAHEQASAALELFQKMKERRLLPSKATLLRIVGACSDVGAAGQGRLVHADIVKMGLDADAAIANAVLEMHASCVGAREAHEMLLGSMPGRDVVSWSVLVSAYARSGEPDSVARCLQEMQAESLLPDRVVFTNVLTACAQAGLLEDGCRYFASMPAGGASPFADHYNCLVDLLSRAGRLSDAYGLLTTMPVHPDIVSWRCLLNACQRCANAGLGRRCMAEIAKFADHLDVEELFEEGILNFDDDDDDNDSDDDDDGNDGNDDDDGNDGNDDDDGGGGGDGDGDGGDDDDDDGDSAHGIAVY